MPSIFIVYKLQNEKIATSQVFIDIYFLGVNPSLFDQKIILTMKEYIFKLHL